ncbi:MAG: MgtC/SapB family protein [Actinomycetota bacterium]
MEGFSEVSLDLQLVIALKVAIAGVLSALIGWERDRAGKAAGTRTMALVGTSAAIVVAVGDVLNSGPLAGDPTRALHAVVTGIGFLGAGLIFTTERSKEIQGVTTAATVFSTACMGVAIGLGFIVTGLIFALVTIAILRSTYVIDKAHAVRSLTKEVEE